MSGGALFDYSYPNFEEACGKWRDEELNELYDDLFCNGRFSVRDYGGLAQSLDFYLSGDTDEEAYREAVARFKAKWMHRTPRSRVEFYQRKLQEYADRYKSELAMGMPTRVVAPSTATVIEKVPMSEIVKLWEGES